MAQWLVEGLTATISGVATVFIVLILIALIIGSLQYVINPKKTIETIKRRKAQKAKSLEIVNETVVESEETVTSVDVPVQDDLELVAVITATIAASLDVSTDRLMVRSIKRVGQNSNWRRR